MSRDLVDRYSGHACGSAGSTGEHHAVPEPSDPGCSERDLHLWIEWLDLRPIASQKVHTCNLLILPSSCVLWCFHPDTLLKSLQMSDSLAWDVCEVAMD